MKQTESSVVPKPKSLQPLPSLDRITITNVDVWNPDGLQSSCDVVVENGLVKTVSPHTKNNLGIVNSMDGSGLVLMPAGVDPQVHLRVPGQPHKETPFTGLYAAIAGGYGAVLNMPNTNPVIDDLDSLARAKAELLPATKHTGVKVLISAALTRGQNGKELTNIEELYKAGVAAFTDDGKGIESDFLMKQGFERLAPLNCPFLQHAEIPGHGGVLAPSKIQEQLGVPAYPASAEVEMVRRDLELLQGVPKARYHVLHVSSRETLRLIKEAQAKGLRVSGEASPHHLFFVGDDISPKDPAFKMNPPLRSAEDREALLAALVNGDLDFVATDHAPHESSAKDKGFLTAPFGTTGLETSLRVLLHFFQLGKLSAQRLVQVFSTNPARFLGIENEFGQIKPGKQFNAVLLNPNAKPTSIELNNLESLSDNNCFRGHKLAGVIHTVFLGTKIWNIHANSPKMTASSGTLTH